MTDPSAPDPFEINSWSMLRRGRLWMLMTVTITTTIWSWNFLRVPLMYNPVVMDVEMLPSDLIGLVIFGSLACLGLRGGKAITVCFVLLALPIFLGFVALLCGYLIQIFLPVRYWPAYTRYDLAYENPREVAFAAINSVFAAFSLWTLLLSNAARLYRCTRRQRIAAWEADAVSLAYRHPS